MSKIKTYKGFDDNLQCRGFQYKVGETYITDENIELCKNGFHAIAEDESPLSVFSYYPPATDGKPTRYCEVEADGKIKSDGDKICCSQLTVGAEIGIPGIVKAHVEWVKKHCTEKKEAGNHSSVSGGNCSSVSAGNRSSVSGGYCSSVVSRGQSAVGKNGVAVARGNGVKVKGGSGSLLVCAIEYDDAYNIKEWKSAIVDGEVIKADTWYTVKDGEFVEVTE